MVKCCINTPLVIFQLPFKFPHERVARVVSLSLPGMWLFSSTPSPCSPRAPSPESWAWQSNSRSKEIFKMCSKQYFDLSRLAPCFCTSMNSLKSFGPSLQSQFQSVPAGLELAPFGSPIPFGRAFRKEIYRQRAWMGNTAAGIPHPYPVLTRGSDA